MSRACVLIWRLLVLREIELPREHGCNCWFPKVLVLDSFCMYIIVYIYIDTYTLYTNIWYMYLLHRFNRICVPPKSPGTVLLRFPVTMDWHILVAFAASISSCAVPSAASALSPGEKVPKNLPQPSLAKGTHSSFHVVQLKTIYMFVSCYVNIYNEYIYIYRKRTCLHAHKHIQSICIWKLYDHSCTGDFLHIEE